MASSVGVNGALTTIARPTVSSPYTDESNLSAIRIVVALGIKLKLCGAVAFTNENAPVPVVWFNILPPAKTFSVTISPLLCNKYTSNVPVELKLLTSKLKRLNPWKSVPFKKVLLKSSTSVSKSSNSVVTVDKPVAFINALSLNF